MEREVRHNASFISSLELRAEMVKGMSWHGQDFVQKSLGERAVSHFFLTLSRSRNMSGHEEVLVCNTQRS